MADMETGSQRPNCIAAAALPAGQVTDWPLRRQRKYGDMHPASMDFISMLRYWEE